MAVDALAMVSRTSDSKSVRGILVCDRTIYGDDGLLQNRCESSFWQICRVIWNCRSLPGTKGSARFRD